jgi:RNA-directed DNA polymerase
VQDRNSYRYLCLRKDSVTNHKRALKNILRKYKSAPRESLIAKLAERIQGWTRYQSVTKCTKYFSYLDKWLFWNLWRWAVKRYKTKDKAIKKCFNVKGWKFGFKSGGTTYILKRHDQTLVKMYVKIKAGASIYSGEILYFCKRMSYHNARIKRLARLMKSQEYRCKLCRLRFMPNDLIELHHVLDDQKSRTGAIEFLHKHCHDRGSRFDFNIHFNECLIVAF